MNVSSTTPNKALSVPLPLAYDAKRDLVWLVFRPWIWLHRVLEIFISLSILTFRLLIQGSSQDERVHQSLAKQLLDTLTNLGPCFIKVGQALSTRPDLIRKDWLEELTNLQDNLPPCSHKKALEIIQEELGKKPNELFLDFPDKPIASASLGQVYKAKLANNYWVAVKVQRPNLEFIIRRDLVLIRLMCLFTSPFLPLNLGVGIDEIIDEFGSKLFEEIDYEIEAKNAEKFSKLFENNSVITIPKVERLFSSRKVITTSWINGTKLKSREELINESLDPSAIIRTGVTSAIQQLLEFGYFHADPHPGNMFALKGQGKASEKGQLAYVDFGMMDEISEKDRLTLTGAIVHLINKDFQSLAIDFQSLGFLSQEKDPSPIAPVLEEVLGGSLGEEVINFNFKSITDKFSELMFDYPFRVPPRFALIIRAVVSQEGLALKLDPDFKIIGVAYPYVAKRLITGETQELVEILLDVIFDKKGGLNLERIQSLLNVISKDIEGNSSDILELYKAGFKLLISNTGKSLRSNLLMSTIKEDRLSTKDIKKLIKIISKTFSPEKIAVGLIQNINPMSA